jgi:hypothetical protein
MNDTTQEVYVFENLIEASTQRNLGEKVEFEAAIPSAHSNALGVVRQMSFEEVGSRAREFGVRFKSMADAQA